MGEVYRARDYRLDRDVAIKVLPATFANDKDRLLRFEQEARATSALNHPNILTIYDIGTHDEAPFIVAELLDGVELREQLNDSPLPVKRALDYGQQIANGLAAAHEKGIVHRDLKPENLFATKDGRVKILDFGLAKLRPPQPAAVDTVAPTQKRFTDPAVVMGTVGYMSPEQVRGQEADHRSDIFAFGAILYEMLSGERPFRGDSAIEVMNAVLKEEPAELGETNAKVSPQLEKLVQRCLEKQPERRFQTAHDLGFALDALSTSSGTRLEAAGASPPRLFGQPRLAWIAVALFMLVALGVMWSYFTGRPAPDAHSMKLSLLPPEKTSFDHLAVSPDGKWLAFTAATGGKVQLWVRAFNAAEAKALAGTDGAHLPFWSPDSRFIAFFVPGKLKKIEASGGLPNTLCDTGVANGGAWSRDGVILFSSRGGSGVSRVSSAGGEVTSVYKSDYFTLPTDWSRDGRFIIYREINPKTKYDVWVLPVSPQAAAPSPFPILHTEANETAAALSPDGQWIAYSSDESGRYEIYIQSFPGGGGKRQLSTSGGIRALWRGDGKELFHHAADGKLMAAPVKGGANLELGVSTPLFEFRADSNLAPHYDVTRDGQKFLLNTIVETKPNAPMTVIVNWAAEAPKMTLTYHQALTLNLV